MLSGAVKRLRTTNQLKEGMERVIIDQRMIILFYSDSLYFILELKQATLVINVEMSSREFFISLSFYRQNDKSEK